MIFFHFFLKEFSDQLDHDRVRAVGEDTEYAELQKLVHSVVRHDFPVRPVIFSYRVPHVFNHAVLFH